MKDNEVLQPRGWGRGSFLFVVVIGNCLFCFLITFFLGIPLMMSSPIVLRTDSQQALSHETIISE